MKHLTRIFFVALLVVLPVVAGAHAEIAPNSQEQGFGMMQQVEDRALGDELHEEMESLMTKMMSGELSQGETDRMVELMNQYPGPGSMMMGRIMNMGMFGSGFNGGTNSSMMGYGFSGFGGGIVMILFWILATIGIVALVKYMMGNSTTRESSKNALDILKERYAEGEIDKDEFDSKKKEIQV